MTASKTLALIRNREDLTDALYALADLDPVMARTIATLPEIPLRNRQPGFAGLAEIVIGQQVSKASASAMLSRLQAELGTITPDGFLQMNEAAHIRLGLSRAKRATLTGVAIELRDGSFDFAELSRMDAEPARSRLQAFKGIGPWSADVYLLFCLGRRDIFPAGDIALQQEAADLLALDERPDAKEMAAIAMRWAPYRSAAARVLWTGYANRRGREVLTG